jgi:hypothetical protein
MAAFEKLPCMPDILLLDGHGYAHPRRVGYACQAGVVLRIPTIGVAKRPLIGEYTLPGQIRGSTSEVIDDGEVIGMAQKTQTGVRPVFVSAGYWTDLDGAVRITHAAGGRHRIPPTTPDGRHSCTMLPRSIFPEMTSNCTTFSRAWVLRPGGTLPAAASNRYIFSKGLSPLLSCKTSPYPGLDVRRRGRSAPPLQQNISRSGIPVCNSFIINHTK